MKIRLGVAHWALSLVILSAIAALVIWFYQRSPISVGTLEKVRIAAPIHPGSALFYIAQERGFFRANGIEVAEQDVKSGKQALDLMLQDKVDLAIVADLPLVFSIAKGNKPIILTSLFRDHGGIGIVARRDRGITSPADLRGKRVGMTFNTSTQFFFDAFLTERQIPTESITLVNLGVEEIADAIITGQVDAVCAWDPALDALQRGLNEQGFTFDSSNQYTFRYQLVTSAGYLPDHKQQLRRLIAALDEAQHYVAEHPMEARKLVQQKTGMNEAAFKRNYDLGEIGLILDQGLLLALDDQTRWAIKRGVVKNGPVPNYLDYMHFDALESVSPHAVTLVH